MLLTCKYPVKMGALLALAVCYYSLTNSHTHSSTPNRQVWMELTSPLPVPSNGERGYGGPADGGGALWLIVRTVI